MRGNLAHQVTYVGAVLFIIGTFMPLVKLPAIGDVSYYRADSTYAIIVVVLAALVPLLILMKKMTHTFLAAAAIWVVLLWPVLKNMGGEGDDSGFFSDLMSQAKDPLKQFASELFTHIDEFNFGGFMFLGGLVILTVGSLLTTLKGK
jgi:hypothetical protein